MTRFANALLSKVQRGALCAVWMLTVLTLAGATAHAQYRVVDTWKIGGEGRWDYLLADPGAHLLYVTHGTRVEVVDTETGKPVGAITGMKAIHGVALNPDGKVGYVSDGGANNVVVFDRKTFKTITTVAAGTNPDGILFEPKTKTVWAFNGRSKNATVIDAATNTVAGTVELGGKPETPIADGKGNIYNAVEDTSEIVHIDAASKKVLARWKLAGCESPSGMAFDPAGRKLFPVCDGKTMAVLNADSGKQLGTATIGDSPDAAGYSAKHGVVFSANGDGTLTVVDGKTFKTAQTVATAKGARTMTYDDKTDRVYLITAQFGPAPAPTAEAPRPRPSVLPGSFEVLVVGR
jgi:YVTN family beta-propeller protein